MVGSASSDDDQNEQLDELEDVDVEPDADVEPEEEEEEEEELENGADDDAVEDEQAYNREQISQSFYSSSITQKGENQPATGPASAANGDGLEGPRVIGNVPIQGLETQPRPTVLLTSPSPQQSPSTVVSMGIKIPQLRPEALTAPVYDIVPTIAAPHSTSINAITATPDLRWVFSGGADGYIRKFNWVETANGKVMLTVAQRHPFVDSVTKAGVLTSYWENDEPKCKSSILCCLFRTN